MLHDGALVLYLERGGKKVLVFDDRSGPAGRRSRRRWPPRCGRAAISRLTIETVGGQPVAASPLGEALLEAGFERTIKGVRLDA